MPETVLETVGLTVRFGGVVAVDHVDFTLREREMRCLIGPNGAGKSTFFRCVTGLLRPTEGQVFMRGEETTSWPVHAVAALGIGVKTQVPSVMDGLTARENVWLSARSHLSAAQPSTGHGRSSTGSHSAGSPTRRWPASPTASASRWNWESWPQGIRGSCCWTSPRPGCRPATWSG